METEYDENVSDYWKLPNGNFIVKSKRDDGLDGDNDVKNTLPSHLGSSILINCKPIMKNFIREINGFYNSNIYYTDTESLYMEKKFWVVSDKVKIVGKNFCQGKNDHETGGMNNGLFLAPKIKYVLTTNEYGIIQQPMTFKGFNDSKRLLQRSRKFIMLEGKKVLAMLPGSWKKSFQDGIIIQTKMRRCNECEDGILCNECNNQVNENKKIGS